MVESRGPVNASKELAALTHEMKNQKMKNLPPEYTVQRRPLYHAPVASPYAGAHVEKVIYVSCHTPVMSAVKRVKKMLSHIEKRASQSTDNDSRDVDKAIADLSEASNRIAKAREEVLVKASGRAMPQALRVGEWFRHKESEMMCKVEVRTGSVQAVDDIVEADPHEEDVPISGKEPEESNLEGPTVLEGGETTMELLGNTSKSSVDENLTKVLSNEPDAQHAIKSGSFQVKRKKRARRKKAMYERESMPEARIRWVKTVEVAISLRA